MTETEIKDTANSAEGPKQSAPQQSASKQSPSVRRSFAFSLIGKYLEFGLVFITTVVLSRLLTPSEIGVFAGALSVIAFTSALKTLGAGQFLISQKRLSWADQRAAFTVSLALALGTAAVLALVAGPLAAWYGEASLSPVLQLLALGLLVAPYTAIGQARLSRDLRFGPQALISATSGAVMTAVSISLVLFGEGVMALAWGTIASQITVALLYVAFVPDLIKLSPTRKGLRAVLIFGGWATGANMVNNIGLNGYLLLVGKALGPTALGLYSRAMAVVERFTGVLIEAAQTVAMPGFAEMRRADKPIGPAFERLLAVMTATIWPFYAWVFLMAEPLVLLLLGDQWLAAVPIARILAVSMILNANMNMMTPPLLTAFGRVRLLFIITLLTASARFLAVYLALSGGVETVAMGVAAVGGMGAPMILLVLKAQFGLRLRIIAFGLLRSALAAAVTAQPALWMMLSGVADAMGRVELLLISSLSGAVLGVLTLFITRHPFYEELAHLLSRARIPHPKPF